jgi:pimeloyl-ACP methyl ester carboxylesterase
MRETMVMLHGGGTDSRCWQQVRPMLERRFEVLTPDLPGHRDEPAPERATVEALAGPISEWIAATVRGPYHLLGHSLGGLVAMTVAATGPAPERLVLADTFDRPAANWRLWFRLLGMDLGARVVGRDRATVKVAEMQGLGHDGFDAVLRTTMHHPAAMSLGAMMAAVRRFDGRPMLDRLEMPVLLLMAGDHAPTEMSGLRMEARLADARRVVLPGAGHMLMRDDPEGFVREVTEFLSDDLSRSA